METASVNIISECYIKPKHTSDEYKEPLHLTPWDLKSISVHYNQKGLLFSKPQSPDFDVFKLIEKLKESLSVALVHFYPFTGRLASSKSEDPPSYVIYVDCHNGPGAKFILAAADITVSEVVSPSYVPRVVHSFFDGDNTVINHDGHTRPLLTVQVTELIDGVFIGCSVNHCLADGSSFWHFFNMWSEIFQLQGIDDVGISQPPIIRRWFPESHGPIINLPYTHHDQFLARSEIADYMERFFHFTSESLLKLKARATAEANNNKISSFQSLYALVWRSITRARGLTSDQKISTKMSADVRSRLIPPLSPNCLGNYVAPLNLVTTAGELLEHNLGWAASLLNQVILNNLSDEKLRGWVDSWIQSPKMLKPGQGDQFSLVMGGSPRFSMYSCEFGLGKAVAIRSGYANKFGGKVVAYSGSKGEGSVDLEVCLPLDTMCALESDKEFLEFLS